jgi:hypothetical protein
MKTFKVWADLGIHSDIIEAKDKEHARKRFIEKWVDRSNELIENGSELHINEVK